MAADVDIDKASADAAKINAAIANANPVPLAPLPPPELINLPGGYKQGETVHRTAVVRELTGEHEEALARALRSGNIYHFLNTLLECGVKSVGDISDPGEVRKAVRGMFIGDRDELVLGVRNATYGNELELIGWECPNCKEQSDLVLDLESDGIDIKRRDLADHSDSVFDVKKLRKGAVARVRLATGDDQLAVAENQSWTIPQRDTKLLSRCVLMITDKNGNVRNMQAQPSLALEMTIPDRRAILKELSERQPGPQYNEIVFRHEDCDGEVSVALGLTDLFRDLLQFL